ncbi:ribonuclease Z [candidate division KSB1 bacterium]|nr:ribonuclease Z [candidate division KSB1 bacterium]
MSDQLKIIFLGTGAAAPSLTRGLPALAIRRQGKIILCDCGEGTQLRLMQAGLSPSKIHTICLSHLHGDHIFGLPGFLTSQQLFGRHAPLTITGPPGLSAYIETIAQISKYTLDYPVKVVELSPDTTSNFRIDQFIVTAKNLRHSSTCLGYRFHEAEKPGKFDAIRADQLGIPPGPQRRHLQHGESIQIENRQIDPGDVVGPSIPGRVITYCTDTRPCAAAVELAQNCDVLIHDSTFSDLYADRAEPTWHSTSREAATLAQEAGVGTLALWHLSIRIQAEEETALLAQARQVFAHTILPNDLDELLVPRRREPH